MTETAKVHCAANGCPGTASMTRATTGTTEWWCCYHFSAQPARIHEVTAELRRLGWLVQLTKCLREFLNTGIWLALYDDALKQVKLNQRGDLELGNESYRQWLHRLEGVLQAACAAPKESQQPLEV